MSSSVQLSRFLPPKNIISEFEKVAKPLFSKQFILAKQNQELTQLRDWLLPMLTNRQVSVNYHLADRPLLLFRKITEAEEKNGKKTPDNR